MLCLSLGQPPNKSPSSVFHFYGLKSQLTPMNLSAMYLPTGSLNTPPSRRGFTYKDFQNSELEAKWTKSMHNLPHKNNKAESNKSSNERMGQHQLKDLRDKLKDSQ